MLTFRSSLVLAVMMLGGTVAHAQDRLPADSMELGRKYSAWFYTGMADSIVAHMDSAGRSRMTADQVRQAMLMVASRAGTEVSLVEEKFITRNGQRQYWRSSNMDILAEPFLLRFIINAKGEIGGYGLGPASQAPPVD